MKWIKAREALSETGLSTVDNPHSCQGGNAFSQRGNELVYCLGCNCHEDGTEVKDCSTEFWKTQGIPYAADILQDRIQKGFQFLWKHYTKKKSLKQCKYILSNLSKQWVRFNIPPQRENNALFPLRLTPLEDNYSEKGGATKKRKSLTVSQRRKQKTTAIFRGLVLER